MDDNKIFFGNYWTKFRFTSEGDSFTWNARHVLESLWHIVKKENPSMQLTIEGASLPLLRTMMTFIFPAFYLTPEI